MSGRHSKHHNTLKLVIIGGGYAGLSALISLRHRAPDAEITLIDPRPYHLLITRLHETVRRPLKEIQIPFTKLARRFNFIHVQQPVRFDEEQLLTWNLQKCIQLDEQSLPFDYLLISVGTQPNSSITADGVYDLDTLSRHCLATELDKLLSATGQSEKTINVIGAGPSGIQFSFELASRLAGSHADYHVNLIDGGDRLLPLFPAAIGRYVKKRLDQKGITLLQSQFYRGQLDRELHLEHAHSGEKSILTSDLTLLLLGKTPRLLLHANSSGQVLVGEKRLNHIFTAGDCSYYDKMGSNLLTSQAAIRKGKAAANNILLKAGILFFCLPYMHRDLGYLLSLGPEDGVGWLVSKNNIISGLPAYLAKQASEAQYDLFLSGIDSYLI
ncbi:NAD(P)/FAD-dependent oxidoreductase [Methylomarinum vadi]|uniref:NAD(P)/FAD-dependent oxidoreductase n=1 Tax=Methylomarinum vadi TaxID=438855 RepID=UPI0004DF78CA|nr:FAD-dependent oxidoreductase [Methylomarinum vadi]